MDRKDFIGRAAKRCSGIGTRSGNSATKTQSDPPDDVGIVLVQFGNIEWKFPQVGLVKNDANCPPDIGKSSTRHASDGHKTLSAYPVQLCKIAGHLVGQRGHELGRIIPLQPDKRQVGAVSRFPARRTQSKIADVAGWKIGKRRVARARIYHQNLQPRLDQRPSNGKPGGTTANYDRV